MRIGLIAPPWLPVPPPSYGGTEAVVDALARGLHQAGHDVLLFTTGDSTCPTPKRYVYRQAERSRLGSTVPELYHAICAYETLSDRDIIHDHTVAGLWCAGHDECPPVVATAHAAFTEELSKIYGAVQDRVAIVAISKHQASRAPGLGFARVIHHGLDPDTFSPGATSGEYLLFLGRMSPDKGVAVAARVALSAGRRLLIAAKIEEQLEQDYFRAEVEPLLGEDVVYLGEVGLAKKRELLAGAVALVNPIRWAEPFGLVMIEALASGTPVLAFPEGAAPEIVDDGVTGFLCRDEADMIAAVGRLDRIDRDACRRAFDGRFTARRMVEDYLSLYRQVVGGRSGSNAA
ncbi:MAG: glycosyltransferase family 4 protein [Acidimicrobiia bacterium]|jgi:glycosyltransferase involved in cell wall biosynthesis